MKKLLIIISIITINLLVGCGNQTAGNDVELDTIWLEMKEQIASDLEENGVENAENYKRT